MISSLGKARLSVHNVHAKQPLLFQTLGDELPYGPLTAPVRW
jgi:hypothetical protein